MGARKPTVMADGPLNGVTQSVRTENPEVQRVADAILSVGVQTSVELAREEAVLLARNACDPCSIDDPGKQRRVKSLQGQYGWLVEQALDELSEC